LRGLKLYELGRSDGRGTHARSQGGVPGAIGMEWLGVQALVPGGAILTFCTKEISEPGGTSAPLMLALVTSDSFANEKAVCV